MSPLYGKRTQAYTSHGRKDAFSYSPLDERPLSKACYGPVNREYEPQTIMKYYRKEEKIIEISLLCLLLLAAFAKASIAIAISSSVVPALAHIIHTAFQKSRFIEALSLAVRISS